MATKGPINPEDPKKEKEKEKEKSKQSGVSAKTAMFEQSKKTPQSNSVTETQKQKTNTPSTVSPKAAGFAKFSVMSVEEKRAQEEKVFAERAQAEREKKAKEEERKKKEEQLKEAKIEADRKRKEKQAQENQLQKDLKILTSQAEVMDKRIKIQKETESGLKASKAKIQESSLAIKSKIKNLENAIQHGTALSEEPKSAGASRSDFLAQVRGGMELKKTKEGQQPTGTSSSKKTGAMSPEDALQDALKKAMRKRNAQLHGKAPIVTSTKSAVKFSVPKAPKAQTTSEKISDAINQLKQSVTTFETLQNNITTLKEEETKLKQELKQLESQERELRDKYRKEAASREASKKEIAKEPDRGAAAPESVEGFSPAPPAPPMEPGAESGIPAAPPMDVEAPAAPPMEVKAEAEVPDAPPMDAPPMEAGAEAESQPAHERESVAPSASPIAKASGIPAAVSGQKRSDRKPNIDSAGISRKAAQSQLNRDILKVQETLIDSQKNTHIELINAIKASKFNKKISEFNNKDTISNFIKGLNDTEKSELSVLYNEVFTKWVSEEKRKAEEKNRIKQEEAKLAQGRLKEILHDNTLFDKLNDILVGKKPQPSVVATAAAVAPAVQAEPVIQAPAAPVAASSVAPAVQAEPISAPAAPVEPIAEAAAVSVAAPPVAAAPAPVGRAAPEAPVAPAVQVEPIAAPVAEKPTPAEPIASEKPVAIPAEPTITVLPPKPPEPSVKELFSPSEYAERIALKQEELLRRENEAAQKAVAAQMRSENKEEKETKEAKETIDRKISTERATSVPKQAVEVERKMDEVKQGRDLGVSERKQIENDEKLNKLFREFSFEKEFSSKKTDTPKFRTYGVRAEQINYLDSVKNALSRSAELEPIEKAKLLYAAMISVQNNLANEWRWTKSESRLESILKHEITKVREILKGSVSEQDLRKIEYDADKKLKTFTTEKGHGLDRLYDKFKPPKPPELKDKPKP